MSIKSFFIGILLGGIVVGSAVWFINMRNTSKEQFAKKERCAIYTQKRQSEANEKGALLGHSISVEGFFSQSANTCMTNSLEIAPGHYMELTLIDELTGKIEAFAFDAMGADLSALSVEGRQEQIKQDNKYHETLNSFRGN